MVPSTLVATVYRWIGSYAIRSYAVRHTFAFLDFLASDSAAAVLRSNKRSVSEAHAVAKKSKTYKERGF